MCVCFFVVFFCFFLFFFFVVVVVFFLFFVCFFSAVAYTVVFKSSELSCQNNFHRRVTQILERVH